MADRYGRHQTSPGGPGDFIGVSKGPPMSPALKRALSDDLPTVVAERESDERRETRLTIYGVGLLQILLVVTAFGFVVMALLGVFGDGQIMEDLSESNIERLANNIGANMQSQLRLDALPRFRHAVDDHTIVYHSAGREALERALAAAQDRQQTDAQREAFARYRQELTQKMIDNQIRDYIAVMNIHRVKDTRQRSSSSDCYVLNSHHARVNPSLPWDVDTKGSGLSEAVAVVAIEASMHNWGKLTTWPVWGARRQNSFAPINIDQDAPDGLCEISFGQIFDENGLASQTILGVTIAWLDTVTQRIIEWDVKLNSAFGFGDASQNIEVIDFLSVMLHELAHCAGLLHSPCSSSVMYPYLNRGQLKRNMTQSDITGFETLYNDKRGFSAATPVPSARRRQISSSDFSDVLAILNQQVLPSSGGEERRASGLFLLFQLTLFGLISSM